MWPIDACQLAASAPNARFSSPFTTLDAHYALGVVQSRTTCKATPLPSVGLWTDPPTGPAAPSDNTGGVSPAATFDYLDVGGVKNTTSQATIHHATFLVPGWRAGRPLESVTLPDLGSPFAKTCDRPNLHVLALTTVLP
jgi:hypothetical protein